MKTRSLLALALLLVIVAGLYASTRLKAERGRPGKAAGPAAPVLTVTATEERHKVSPPMLDRATTRQGQAAPSFREKDAEGKLVDLAQWWKTGPVVVVFIQDGCPCSVAAEGFFNGLHASYRGRVRFVGIIDDDAEDARKWADRNGVPFPLVPDKSLKITREFGAENSAYVALIDRDGKLDAFWPGFSVSMLRDLNARIARLSGLKEEPIDTTDAPDELYSGCPFP